MDTLKYTFWLIKGVSRGYSLTATAKTEFLKKYYHSARSLSP